ncbi:uncharacterized protein LOC141910780 isoform X2 [Tubulanus polymorphus]|uniref:uncharacterized protein LOC141910780 isoform X2 n=1 Tax=Tubulanus polymorphus TaxID=672921 RepID=UPI003DA208A3
MAMVSPTMMNLANVKDSRWLTLEVCREYQRNKCTRPDTECKFAHPPAHVEVQNGRVTCCFDSIKGKCQRKEPPCKYLHPPQHLREQLLQNGKNNLILKNLQMQVAQAYGMMPMIPNAMPYWRQTPNESSSASTSSAAAAAAAATAAAAVASSTSAPSVASTSTTTTTTPRYTPVVAAAAASAPGGVATLNHHHGTFPPTPSPTAGYIDGYRLRFTSPEMLPYAHPTYFNPGLQTAASFNPYLTSGVAMPGIMQTQDGSPVPQHAGQIQTLPVQQAGPTAKTTVPRADRLEPNDHNHQAVQIRTTPNPVAIQGPPQQWTTQPPPQEVPCTCGMTGMPGMVPMMKRPAVADAKSGLPVYQPASNVAAYQQALAVAQLQQGQGYVPVSFTGHHPGVPRF